MPVHPDRAVRDRNHRGHLPAAVPAQAGVEVGRQICEELSRTAADRSFGPPTVAGVRVEGTYAD